MATRALERIKTPPREKSHRPSRERDNNLSHENPLWPRESLEPVVWLNLEPGERAVNHNVTKADRALRGVAMREGNSLNEISSALEMNRA